MVIAGCDVGVMWLLQVVYWVDVSVCDGTVAIEGWVDVGCVVWLLQKARKM